MNQQLNLCEKKALVFEKIANDFGSRLAKGYIDNYHVGDVYEEAQNWVKDLAKKGEIEFGYVRETYPKIDVAFEISLCPIGCNRLFFFKTEWYLDNGEISHGFGSRELYIKE